MSQEDDKIKEFITNEIAPLFEIWSLNAKLGDVEKKVLYHKMFNPQKLSNAKIASILNYSERQIRRIWRKVQRKIYKILP